MSKSKPLPIRAAAAMVLAFASWTGSGLSAQEKTTGEDFVPLFNHESLEGWLDRENASWTVDNTELTGRLTTEPGRERGGFLLSSRDYRDFTFRMTYRMEKGTAEFRFLASAEAEGDRVTLTGPAVPLTADGPDRWHVFELTLRDSRAIAKRDGVLVAEFSAAELPQTLPPVSRLAIHLPPGENARLRISRIEIHEHGRLEQLAAWMRRLGYARHFRQPAFAIQSGHTVTLEDGSRQPQIFYGFPILDIDPHAIRIGNGDWIKAITLDLDTVELTARPAGDDPEKSPAVSWKGADLRKHAESWLDSPWKSYAYERRDRSVRPILDYPVYAVSLATALRENGHWDLAERLLEKALSCREHAPWANDIDAFRSFLATEFANTELARAVREHADPKSSPTEFRTRLDAITHQFPETKAAGEAAMLLRGLANSGQIGDDEPFLSEILIDGLPIEDRVAELIRQLETQNGRQFNLPGRCDIFTDPRRERSPAARLVKLGHPAVPQLIEALHDPRLTRSIGVGNPVDYTMRAGECAKVILESIAGRRFSRSFYSMAEGEQPLAEKNIRSWWAEAEGNSEFDILAAAVERGEDDAPHAAATLLDRYPEDGLPEIIGTAKHSDNPDIREPLITIAARAGLVASGEFLREELESGTFTGGRARAAAALWMLGEKDRATTAMIAEWRRRRDAGFPKDEGEVRGHRYARSLGGAGAFLARYQSPGGFSALGESWANLPLRIRENFLYRWGADDGWSSLDNDLVSAPSPRGTESRFGIFSAGLGYPGSYQSENLTTGGKGTTMTMGSQPPSNGEIANRVDVILAESLSETARCFHANSSGGSHPRLCDLAAEILARRRHEEFSFDPKASWKQREKQRIEILNTFRLADGEPVIAPPDWNRADPVAPGHIASVSVSTPEDSLAALVQILKTVDQWAGKPPDREALISLTRQMARVLPAGWEFSLQLEGDPEIAAGLDLEIRTGPYDHAIHARDIEPMKAGWLWRFFRAEKFGESNPFSQQTESKVYQRGGRSMDYFYDGLDEFGEAMSPVLDPAAKEAVAVFIHLRRAPNPEE